jgi:hypothetical protein
MIADDCASVHPVRTKYWDLSMTADVLANMMTVDTFASVMIEARAFTWPSTATPSPGDDIE